MSAPALLTVDDVATRLALSVKSVRRLLKAERIAAVKLERQWRVDPRELERYIARQRFVAPVTPVQTTRRPWTVQRGRVPALSLPGADTFL